MISRELSISGDLLQCKREQSNLMFTSGCGCSHSITSANTPTKAYSSHITSSPTKSHETYQQTCAPRRLIGVFHLATSYLKLYRPWFSSRTEQTTRRTQHFSSPRKGRSCSEMKTALFILLYWYSQCANEAFLSHAPSLYTTTTYPSAGALLQGHEIHKIVGYVAFVEEGLHEDSRFRGAGETRICEI